MLGIAIFGFCAFGLGLLVPLRRDSEAEAIGLRFALGAALLIVALSLLAAMANLGLGITAAVLGGLALLGWISAIARRHQVVSTAALSHPALWLPLLCGAAVAAHGGMGYQPYLIDEFTNWLGPSRLIHWAGSYDAVRDRLYLPDYTPGWRLLLLLPWQVEGKVDFGSSAAAPLILHISVLALLYDMAVRVLRRDAGFTVTVARFYAWAFVLLLLAAEGMGALWTHEMLIEQPQIYLLTAVLFLLLQSDLSADRRRVFYGAVGLLLAADYLLKSAALASLPALFLLAIAELIDRQLALRQRLSNAGLAALALAGPMFAILLAWNMQAPEGSCLGSPMALLQGNIPASYDPLDLARRFLGALMSYVWTYKMPVTVAALIGIGCGLRLGLFRAPLFWLAFAGVYFATLYAYHLTCFGDYYYRELNSIPRFTRVPLQAFQTLGLTMLLIAVVRFVGALRIAAIRPMTLLSVALVAVALVALQARSVYRTVVDVTTRVYQSGDQRIAEMEQAARFAAAHFGDRSASPPQLAILDQGEDADVIGYATFFATHAAGKDVRQWFIPYGQSSWAPVPLNVWQHKATEDGLRRTFAQMEILWPLKLDGWLEAVLMPLIPDPACRASLQRAALLRDPGTETPRFSCVPKDP